jgi:hypothetical protein
MTETVHGDYEVSSEGAVRHWEFPYARLTDITPTPTNAARVTGLLVGHMLTGTILTIEASRSVAVVDVTPSMVYRHDVRNVLTYNGAEASWGAINIGDPVYYDASATMVALGIYLSTSPLAIGGGANSFFGWVVPSDEVDMALFPKGGAAASTQRCAVMQCGSGAA